MAGEGLPAEEITDHVGRSAETVRRQRASYARDGLDGLRDRPKTRQAADAWPRRPRTVDRVGVHASCEHTRSCAARALDTSRSGRDGQDVCVPSAPDPARRRRASAPDGVLGDERAQTGLRRRRARLYLDPPANAIVVSIDEKTSIAALSPPVPIGSHSGAGRHAATASTRATPRRTSSPRCRCIPARSPA
jgi:hypothetical protein